MFFLTAVLLCVLAFAQAVPMNPVRLVISPHITSPTESTVWHPGDQVNVTWDTSVIPAEGDFPGVLVLGQPENLDVDHPLAQDFSLRAGSVELAVPDVKPGSNYIVVLLGDSANASPPFTIKSQSELVKKAPQDSGPFIDSPDSDPTEDDPEDPETETSSSSRLSTSTSSTTSSTASRAAAAAATATSTTPSTSGSGSNGAFSFAHAHHTGAISLCAAVAAMSLMFVM